MKAKTKPSDIEARVRSRRDLLKLAGAAAVGAAGAAAMRVVPAAAANGDTITVGGSFTGTSLTSITNTNTGGTAFAANGGPSGLGLWGSGTNINATGVYGSTDLGTGVFGDVTSTGPGTGIGVVGRAVNASGVGLWGQANREGGLGAYLSGGRAPLRLVPQGAPGPPVTNAHAGGDIWLDAAGILWVCITAGTPGTFVPLQTGGANLTHFVKVSNKQYNLPNSDGMTWVDMDAAGLALVITPFFNAQAIISISVDLWTANSGFNQDVGIFISGGAYGTGQIVAWKESGGSAGTFSPNAAFVETTQPLVAGTAYTIKVRWKTNQPAAGATIFAGAGPLPVGSGGGGVAGQFSPTRLAIHLVVDVPSPATLHIPANDPTKTPPPPVAPLPPRP